MHDILDGIAHSRLVVADITSVRMKDVHGKEWPQRNGNVMWEVGIAHVMRIPDEVLLIRSDDDDAIFDLTQFRAFQYDPNDVSAARTFLLTLARDRLRAIDQTKSAYVRKCADALDPHSIDFLLHGCPFVGPPFDISLNLVNATMLPRLFELGILEASQWTVVKADDDAGQAHSDIKYSVTKFGQDVAMFIAGKFNFNPET